MFQKLLLRADSPFRVAHYNWLLVFCCLLGLFLRISAFFLESTISTDGVTYVFMAEHWLKTGAPPYNLYLPLYPWIMKLLMCCGVSAFSAGIGINILLGSFLPLICYGILRLLVARREVAVAGALLTAVHPSLIDLSINIQRDTPYLFFCGCAIFCLLHAVRSSKWYWWGFCGCFLVPGIFSRYETLEFFPLIMLYLFAAAVFKVISWKKALACFLSFGIACVILYFVLVRLMNVEERMWKTYRQRIEIVLKQKI